MWIKDYRYVYDHIYTLWRMMIIKEAARGDKCDIMVDIIINIVKYEMFGI